MANWLGGFSGVGFDRTEFAKWLSTQKKPAWAKFIAIHATGAPYTLATVGAAARMKNLGHYYRTKGWPGGPHGFAMGTKVYGGTPFNLQGVHSPSWNKSSIALECEGDYRKGAKHSPKTGLGAINWDTMAWATAELLKWLELPANATSIRFHREDAATSHRECPGDVDKAWFVAKVKANMGGEVVAFPKATENRPEPSKPRQTLKKGMAGNGVRLLQEALNKNGANPPLKLDGDFGPITEKTLKAFQASHGLVQDGICGSLSWTELTRSAVSEPPTPAEPPKPAPVPDLPPPSDPIPIWSETWCLPMMKKVEGLRLAAYFDKPGWAIGYGHNSTSKVPPIPYEGMTLKDEKEAETILRADLHECRRYLLAWVKVPLTQAQVDALCMHIFQQGPTQFRNRVLPAVNRGEHDEAAKLIETMEHANPGVMRRRRFEASRYRGETPTKW